jgi:Xaa-Pro aminopeptidase
MIDFGTVLNGYHMDETRMFVIGKMPERAMKASLAAMEIRNTILENVKPGVSMDDLFQISVEKAKSLGYEKEYLGPPDNKVSFVGHGIGLELVEPPFLASRKYSRLVAGMTLAIEPKMLFEGEFSAGIEDVFQVTETGYRMISKVPTTVFIC